MTDYTKYDNMSYVELKNEREEIECAIANERIWQKGSDDFDGAWMHGQNIEALNEEFEYVSDKMEEKFLAAVEHFSKELGSELDPECLNKDELVFCFENKSSLIDYDFWVRYEALVGEALVYDEYRAIDSEFDGDPHDVEPEDVRVIEGFKEFLHKHRMAMFVFDDELMFGQDDDRETVDGYVWAIDKLVDRMKGVVKDKHTPEEIESFDNINFYPIYNCWTCTVKIEGTYYYFDKDDKEDQGVFELPLSDAERAALIDAMEAYCERTCGCSCTAKLNEIRAEEGLAELNGFNSVMKSEECTMKNEGSFSAEGEKLDLDMKIAEAATTGTNVPKHSIGSKGDLQR